MLQSVLVKAGYIESGQVDACLKGSGTGVLKIIIGEGSLMFLRCAAMACVFFCAPAALACSLKSGVQPFAVQGQASSAAVGVLKAPLVEVISITRGIGTRHASCDDTGLLSLKVEWPRGTDYKLRDIGFEFRVVSGDDSYAIFPQAAVTGHVDGRDREFLFIWRDGPPSQQQALDLKVEVRAVTADNQRGPATLATISVSPGS